MIKRYYNMKKLEFKVGVAIPYDIKFTLQEMYTLVHSCC